MDGRFPQLYRNIYREKVKYQFACFGENRRNLTGFQICHCEEAAGRRGALSAQREEVPLGCNLGKALTISPMTFLLSNLVLRDSHVASLLGMTNLFALRQ